MLELPSAINCVFDLSLSVQTYVEAGIAPATRRAYRSDLDHFQAWGGSIPSADGQLAAYLVAHATTLAVAALVRRLNANELRTSPKPAFTLPDGLC